MPLAILLLLYFPKKYLVTFIWQGVKPAQEIRDKNSTFAPTNAKTEDFE